MGKKGPKSTKPQPFTSYLQKPGKYNHSKRRFKSRAKRIKENNERFPGHRPSE